MYKIYGSSTKIHIRDFYVKVQQKLNLFDKKDVLIKSVIVITIVLTSA